MSPKWSPPPQKGPRCPEQALSRSSNSSSSSSSSSNSSSSNNNNRRSSSSSSSNRSSTPAKWPRVTQPVVTCCVFESPVCKMVHNIWQWCTMWNNGAQCCCIKECWCRIEQRVLGGQFFIAIIGRRCSRLAAGVRRASVSITSSSSFSSFYLPQELSTFPSTFSFLIIV